MEQGKEPTNRAIITIATISIGFIIVATIFFGLRKLWTAPVGPKNTRVSKNEIEQLHIQTFCLEGQEHYLIRDYKDHTRPGFSVVLRVEPNGKPKKCKKESGNVE